MKHKKTIDNASSYFDEQIGHFTLLEKADKIFEETEELVEAIKTGSKKDVIDECGDVLSIAFHIAYLFGYKGTPGDLYVKQYEKMKRRIENGERNYKTNIRPVMNIIKKRAINLDRNIEITVDTINSYVGKPILLSYGNIDYGWIGIFESIDYYNIENMRLDNAGIRLSNCCTLINYGELIPIKDCDFDKKYLSDGQLQVHEPTKRQLRSYYTRVKHLNV